MRKDLCPSGAVEEILADRAAQLAWKLRRVPVAEAAAADVLIERARQKHEAEQRAKYVRKSMPFHAPPAMELVGASFTADSECAFERLQIYEQRIERQFHACLNQLRLLRKMKKEQGESSECDRSAELGIETEESCPRMDTNLQESEKAESGAQARSSGVSPVDPSPPSFSLTENNKEKRDEGTGETPELQLARPELIRVDSFKFVDQPHCDQPENAGEGTKPILAQPLAGE